MERHDPLTAGDAIRSFYEAYATGVGKPRWGDKSPPYTWKALRIQRALPRPISSTSSATGATWRSRSAR